MCAVVAAAVGITGVVTTPSPSSTYACRSVAARVVSSDQMHP